MFACGGGGGGLVDLKCGGLLVVKGCVFHVLDCPGAPQDGVLGGGWLGSVLADTCIFWGMVSEPMQHTVRKQ